MYFEYSIPKQMPSHMHYSNASDWERMYNAVSSRMELLEKAKDLSGLDGEDFSAAVQHLFKKEDDFPKLDTMSPEQIAQNAITTSITNPKQPKRFDWSTVDVIVDTAFTTTKEWEMIRHLGLGGSDSSAYAGAEHFATKFTLYHDKIGTPMAKKQIPLSTQFVWDYGHILEPLVIKYCCYEIHAKRIPESRMFRSKTYPWLVANPDAVITLPPSKEYPDGRLYLFEAKTTGKFTGKEDWDGNKIPPHYVTQCRHYMMVFNDPRILGTYIGVIYSNTIADKKTKPVERDLQIEKLQLQRAKDFWENHVLVHREPTPGDRPDVDEALIRSITGQAIDNSESPITLPAEAKTIIADVVSIDEKIKDTKIHLKKLEKERDSGQTKIKNMLGNKTKAVFVDIVNQIRYEISWAAQSREVVDKEALKDFPDAYAAAVKINPEYSRPFKINARKLPK